MTYAEEFVNDNVSVHSFNRTTNHIIGSNDKRYYQLNRQNQKGEKKKVGCFSSGAQGSSIRNAVTGVYNYSHKVGSAAEYQYFSVIIATGESKNRERIILFYDNPQQYEKHFFVDLDSDTKERWFQKESYIRKLK